MGVGKTINAVTLVGYVYGKSEYQYFADGQKVCRFVIKTFSSTKNVSGGVESSPELTRCNVWGDVSPNMESEIIAGNLLYVEGSMRTSKYKDKINKLWTFSTQINCRCVNMMSRPVKK